jgi:hypothetical protein
MQAEFSVEIGPDAAALEIPWRSDDGSLRYLDLRAQPELLLNIKEAHIYRPLGEFLSSMNSAGSLLQSAKCDTWTTRKLEPEEEVFGSACKFASYVDLIFADDAPRFSFEQHERLGLAACKLLGKAPEISAAAEFVLRRCYFHDDDANLDDSRDGYCLTLYASGYGDDEEEAQRRWTIGLKLLENALLQLSASGY